MRVLDLSRLLPGPYCSKILTEFGAEVIKVESPEGWDWLRYVPPLGDDGQSLLYHTLNGGKRSLTLNLRSAEGRAIMLQLVETADVFLESYRPGALERRGLGYERLAQLNPRLVYCSLSGYGSEGPYRLRAGHDLNYVGLAGLLDLNGPRSGPPSIPGTQVADLTGAMWAALGILAALLERERTGQGQQVEASLFGGALSCLPVAVARSAGGEPMARGADDLTGGVVCYNVYETADGRYVTLAALEPEFWSCFCRAAGREELVSQQLAPAVPGEEAYEELCALFRTRTQAEWAALMAEDDTCCEPVHTVGEALQSAAVKALGLAASGGWLPAARLSSRPLHLAGAAPTLGQHTAELLGELGYDQAAIERLRRQGVV